MDRLQRLQALQKDVAFTFGEAEQEINLLSGLASGKLFKFSEEKEQDYQQLLATVKSQGEIAAKNLEQALLITQAKVNGRLKMRETMDELFNQMDFEQAEMETRLHESLAQALRNEHKTRTQLEDSYHRIDQLTNRVNTLGHRLQLTSSQESAVCKCLKTLKAKFKQKETEVANVYDELQRVLEENKAYQEEVAESSTVNQALERDCKGLETRYTEVQRAMNDLTADKNQLRAQLQAEEEGCRLLHADFVLLVHAYNSSQQNVQQMQLTLDAQAKSLQAMKSVKQENKNQKDRLSTLEEELSKKKQEMKQLQMDIADLKTVREDLQHALTKEKEKNAMMKAGLQHQIKLTEAQAADLSAKLADAQKQNETLQKDSAEREQKAAESNASLGETVQRLQEELAQKQSQIEHDTSMHAQDAEQIKHLSEKLEILNKQAEDREQTIRDASLKLERFEACGNRLLQLAHHLEIDSVPDHLSSTNDASFTEEVGRTLAELEGACQKMGQEAKECRAILSEKSAELDLCNANLAELEKTIAQIKEDLSASKTREAERRTELGDALQQVTSKENAVHTLQLQLAEQKALNAETNQMLEGARNQAGQLAQDHQHALKELESSNQQIADLRAQMDVVEDLKVNVERLETSLGQAKEALDEKEQTVREHQQRAEDMKAEITQLKNDLESLQDKINHLNTTTEEQKAEIARLNHKVQSIAEEMTEDIVEPLQAKYTDLTSEKETLHEDNLKMRQKVEDLEEALNKEIRSAKEKSEKLDQLQKWNTSLKEELDSARKPSTSGNASTKTKTVEDASPSMSADRNTSFTTEKTSDTTSTISSINTTATTSKTPTLKERLRQSDSPSKTKNKRTLTRLDMDITSPSPKKTRSDAMEANGNISNVISKAATSSGRTVKATAKIVVVAFSGFRDKEKVYNTKYREKLERIVRELNGSIYAGSDEFDLQITHVISPPRSRTLKCFAAALTSRWIIDPKWLEESHKVNEFLSEEPYGQKYTEKPFKDHAFFIAPSFKKESGKKTWRMDNCKQLIETFGEGRLVQEASDADIVICAANDTSHYKSKETWDWNTFIKHIPGSEIVAMLGTLLASLAHPSELKVLIKYKFFTSNNNIKQNRQIIANDPDKRKCYELLEATSRSFAMVIQELDVELRDAVCIFYLVLRGLDTVEDDMTLPLPRKTEILLKFHELIYQEGWTFNEIMLDGPNEKDRHLLVTFDTVIREFLRLKPRYQQVIADITKAMGKGMADFANGEYRENLSIKTKKDYDLYCHVVAGLVGWGLSDLFSASELEGPEIAADRAKSNSMGLFLQKTNIVRDYHEDLLDGRQFWPKEIWGDYIFKFADLAKQPTNEREALDCLAAMVINAMEHVADALHYLQALKNQSIFNFCAIPQVMAIATLALVFENIDVFKTKVKIRKGETVKLILGCQTMTDVVGIFRHYVRVISQKNDPRNKNFMNVSIVVGKIEAMIEKDFPKEVKALEARTKNDTSLYIAAILIGVLSLIVYRYVA
ncbi:hypothetical protein BZG36_03291 [Bifiguratus adelaidae]|uniref:squalene synthase n=1 Tax=Bifiguratus adelaidae TaxID=1938954 RepID=A0A261XZX8_9FUNG|nr:hypothetical protein BZG36_03291 [Bifiguratus adelaidae]